MSIKTYIRGIERTPVDTLRYAACANYIISRAEALPDYGTFIDVKTVYFNAVDYIIVVYETV